jgi:hypothetical protein
MIMADLYVRMGQSVGGEVMVKYKDCGDHFALCMYAEPLERYESKVALGQVMGVSHIDKFGRNADIDQAAVEDVWDGGGVWVEPTAARIHDIASTDAADTADGTGARTMEVYGLDGDYNMIGETRSLDGLSNVATENAYRMIYRKIVRSAGAGGKNAGTITATARVDGTVTAQISPGFNQTLMAVFQVPAGVTGLVWGYFLDINEGTGNVQVTYDLLFKPPEEVWQTKHHRGFRLPAATGQLHEFKIPKVAEEKTLIKLGNVGVSVANCDVSGGFLVELVSS